MKKRKLTPQNTITIATTFNKGGTPELDFEMYDDVLGHDNVQKAYDEDGIETIYMKGGMFHDSYPIKITELRKLIAKISSTGANYVAIDYNCDHPDYTFIGLDIHAATAAELEEYDNQQKKIEDVKLENLRKKKEEVQKEIDLLTNKPN